MLERREHRLEHLTIDLAVLSIDDEIRELARVLASLANDPCESRHVTLEGHHARLHEPALQLCGDARLLGQQRIRFVGEPVQQLVDARHVICGLRKGARQLLDRRVAIELERIEAALHIDVVLVAVQDLRLGLGFQLAQLIA